MILSISAAATAAGIDRRTLQRAIKNGRLSATTNAAGERGIDLAELIRVFGPLPEMSQGVSQGQEAAQSHLIPTDAAGATLIEVLRDQVRQTQEQLRQAHDREQQAQAEKMRLLTLLEIEQQARRDLETKLLPAPQRKPVASNLRLLVMILVLMGLAVTWVWPDWITRLFTTSPP